MAANIKSVGYQPAYAPTDIKYMSNHVDTELFKIAGAINKLAVGHVDPTFVEPPKPRDGDFRVADGTEWNPGNGQGFYVYYNGAWNIQGTDPNFLPTYPLTTAAPASPIEGRIYRANGTTWNPGSGRGFYGYDNGTYRFLG